jgi:uncharacterized protein YciW
MPASLPAHLTSSTIKRNQLDEVGLTTYDIVLINQIIGFIGFQARVVARFRPSGHPVRWLPGHHIQPHALP